MTPAQNNHQSTIWYSACNEDPPSEVDALHPENKRILSITASGSRVFDLLLANPTEVVAIDRNPAQSALAELFAAAYIHCDYNEFCGLTGLHEYSRRGECINTLIPSLSPAARTFWEHNHGLAVNGLLYCGRWEGFLRRFRQWAGKKRRDLSKRLLACIDVEEQWDLWQTEWDDWQWHLFLRILACRPLWRWGLREPGIAFVPNDFDMTDYARKRFNHAARHIHLAKSPFAWLLLNGAYTPQVLPDYLTEAGHAVIRKRIGRLKLVTASLQETLTVSAPESFDGVSLSDYSSYCDLAEQRRVWCALARCLRPGGRVCERKFFNKTGMHVPLEFGFSRNDNQEEKLNASDRAWFYTFVVASKKA